MKNINSLSAPQKTVLAVAFSLFFIIGIIIFAHKTYAPLEVREGIPCSSEILEYTGFDGEKHQAIFINTGQHNWVLVEKK